MKKIVLLLVVHIVTAFPSPKMMENNTDTRLMENILSHMNPESSACDNYYEYACGKYADRDILEMLSQGVYDDLKKQIMKLHRRSLMQDLNESSLEAKILRYHQTCRHAPQETWSLEHFLKLASPGVGFTWPLLTPPTTKWPRDRFNWMDTLALLQSYGLTNVLINVEVAHNKEFSPDPLLKLSMPSYERYLRKDSLESLQKISVKFNRPIPFYQLKRLNMGLVMRRLDIRRTKDVYYMSVEEIEQATGLNCLKFIETIVGHRISPKFRVMVKDFNYFASLKGQMDSMDTKLLATYLMSRFFFYLKDNTLAGGEPIKCLYSLSRNMNFATNLLYKERFQDPRTLQRNIQEVEHIFEQLRYQLVQKINRNQRLGLSDEQRKFVVEKVQSIVLNIGNMPRDLDHRTFVSRYYENLDISSKERDYGRVQLELLKLRIRMEMDQKLQAASSFGNHFHITHPNVNFMGPASVYYVVDRNFIVLPYAILQEPFFTYDSHDVFKYSLMGHVLAHEMMHAIGNHIVLDNKGNLQITGLEVLSLTEFQRSLNCMNRNRTEYLDERMADIEGLRLAYSTYSSRNHQNRNDIHSTDFNPEQIFILNVAQLFCSKSSRGELLKQDGDQLRLQQIVNNYDPFYRAFGCQRKREDCEIW